MDFAHDGEEALAILGTSAKYDLVLSDINMPRMDGLTMLKQIPSVDPDVRAVIVSAYGDMKNIRTAMNLGAFDFVTKPIDFRDLKITIDRSLRNLKIWRDAVRAREKLVGIESELGLARRMQRSILPAEFPESPHFEVFASMNPAKEVAGDFFDIVGLDRGVLGFSIADVSGKGVPAALFMMSSRTLLKGAAIGGASPADVLAEVNSVLAGENSELMFVTMLYGTFNPETGLLRYSTGGHESPLVVRRDGTVVGLPSTEGIALGVLDGVDFSVSEFDLEPGDTVVLYTDGVTDSQKENGERFGLQRLIEVLGSSPAESATEVVERVVGAGREFAGNAGQFDDLTCLALRRTE